MAYAKLTTSRAYGGESGLEDGRLLVLLLLTRRRVLRAFLSTLVAVAALLIGGGPRSATAAERTFVLAPADLVAAPDAFGAKALARSGVLGKVVGLKRGAVRFGRGLCPSLLMDPTRRLTRVRVLGGPAAAPLVVGKSLAKDLGAALAAMNAASWLPPAAGRTRQASWVSEPPAVDVVGFTTAGFATGDQTGALGKADAENGVPGFRFAVDLAFDPNTGPVDLAVAVTSELPSKRVGKPGKRTECIMVVSMLPVDLQALRDLVDATPLDSVTRNRLTYILDRAQGFLDGGRPEGPSRAARNVRTFALEVAQRSETEIPPAFAEAMITRANAAAEALSF
ncbi:MAG: hypothetical protein IT293_07360 [Deltaproteobacteria bacterium]|nr:hypothetical protein [Deltaproteobacteria bacterium]